jgi:hypothetical protein
VSSVSTMTVGLPTGVWFLVGAGIFLSAFYNHVCGKFSTTVFVTLHHHNRSVTGSNEICSMDTPTTEIDSRFA